MANRYIVQTPSGNEIVTLQETIITIDRVSSTVFVGKAQRSGIRASGGSMRETYAVLLRLLAARG